MSSATKTKRRAFFASDRTGITAETLGHALLTQFEDLQIMEESLRFIDSEGLACEARDKINQAAAEDETRPLVFSTLIDSQLREILSSGNCLFFDFFDTFIGPLAQELQVKPNLTVGRSHGLIDVDEYSSRIEAVNFTLRHDDGGTLRHLEDAEIILIGISRTGKTPTCLYLSLHYGIPAANFPLVEDDLEEVHLPPTLKPYENKLIGLTTDPARLHQIRNERLPNSRYASLRQCEFETRQAEGLYRKFGIPHLHTTMKSIEEIATKIIQMAQLERHRPPYRTPIHT